VHDTEQPQAILEVSEIRLELKRLLSIALTKRKISLGGKDVAEREDLPAAIRVMELLLRTYELDAKTPEGILLQLLDAPDFIATSWLEINRWLFAGKRFRYRATHDAEQTPLSRNHTEEHA